MDVPVIPYVQEGAKVRVREATLSSLSKTDQKRFGKREGTVVCIFVPLGGARQCARVQWHLRAGRGKEFQEVFRVSDLEVMNPTVKTRGL